MSCCQHRKTVLDFTSVTQEDTKEHRLRKLFLFVVIIGSAWAGPSVDSLCSQAAYLFFNRHLDSTYLDSAFNLLAIGRKTEPEHEQCLYLWSRIHTKKADLSHDKSEKRKLYERAMAIAETLKTIDEENPDGHMWWAVAYGCIGRMQGIAKSLFMVPTLKKEFGRVLDLDSTYTAAYEAFGELYYELPALVGGNLKKSEEFLVAGLKTDPDYTRLRLELSKVYIQQKRWQEAKEQLNNLMATKKPTCPADFELDDKLEALGLLDRIKDK